MDHTLDKYYNVSGGTGLVKDGAAAEASFGLPTAISFGGNVHGPVLYVADFYQAGPRVLYTTAPSPTNLPTTRPSSPSFVPTPSSS